MDHNRPRDRDDLPSGDPESKEQGEEAARELDKIPAPGTDPLHEGP